MRSPCLLRSSCLLAVFWETGCGFPTFFLALEPPSNDGALCFNPPCFFPTYPRCNNCFDTCVRSQARCTACIVISSLFLSVSDDLKALTFEDLVCALEMCETCFTPALAARQLPRMILEPCKCLALLFSASKGIACSLPVFNVHDHFPHPFSTLLVIWRFPSS